MYIGAWTEYRLAQEQAQNSGRQYAAQQHDDIGSTRPGAGIYHPSLSSKGGMEVSELPDRESFRRTLESALSSNLAADDAENISQALEPLMQRLPSIHPAVRASKRKPRGRTSASTGRSAQLPCRQHKRKALDRRYGGGPSRYIHTRSDAGTRPAAEPTSDGTRSTRSGFSAASAPLDTAAGQEEPGARYLRLHGDGRSGGFGLGGQYRQGRPDGRSRTSHLPLIIDTRRRRRNTHGSDTTYSGHTHGTNITPRSFQSASTSIELNKTCEIPEEDNSSCGTTNRPSTTAPPHLADGVSRYDHYDKDVVSEKGGYDGGAAATILRMARRRDPVGLKADFEQFWTWKRRTPTPTTTTGKKGAPSATKSNIFSGKTKGGGRRNVSPPSKLEALERMKAVYMAKEIDGCAYIPAATTTDPPGGRNPTTVPSTEPRRPDNTVRAPHCEIAEKTYPPTETSRGTHTKLFGNTDGETGAAVQPNREAAAKPGAHDSGFGLDEFEGGDTVDVPDLELTESRIRQVEKYFGSSGGGVGGGLELWRPRPSEV